MNHNSFVQKHAENKRQAAVRKKKKQESLQKSVQDIHMRPITSHFHKKTCLQTSLYPSVYYMLHPLFTTAEDGFDCIMDEALADYGTKLRARINDMHLQAGSPTKDVRERLWDFKASQEKLGNTKAALLANAYIIFQQICARTTGRA
jgi:hypothetical protein